MAGCQYLYDETGRAYLDVYNNVPLVGHSHPRVVRAAKEQLALLNTNTRYLHENFVRYAERLTALLPAPLRVCFFLNSGSEANELALRLARAYTGREDVIVLEHAYHGHTQATDRRQPLQVRLARAARAEGRASTSPRCPTITGAPTGADDPEAGRKYASHVGEIVTEMRGHGRGLAAFLAETLPERGRADRVPARLPRRGLRPRARRGRSLHRRRGAGGLRPPGHALLGLRDPGRGARHRRARQAHRQRLPPRGGAHHPSRSPRPSTNGMEFFSTFGGNPVACAAGLAVLDVLAEERLQERALRVGGRFLTGLRALSERHPLVGDVRGSGLFLGVELVRDRESREPAGEEASYVVNRLREQGILTGTDGPHDNVFKIRPPLVVSESDVDLFVSALDEVLREDPVRVGER